MAFLTELRQAIEQRFPDALPLHHAATPSSVPTGIVAVDALLPGAGLPRGRLTMPVGTDDSVAAWWSGSASGNRCSIAWRSSVREAMNRI